MSERRTLSRVVFLHTVSGLEERFQKMLRDACDREVDVMHVRDETIIRSVVENRGLTPYARRRVSEHVLAAAESGADVVQFTCSTISSLAEPMSNVSGITVLSVDARMALEVVKGHVRIALFATNPGTINPSEEQIRHAAAHVGRRIDLEVTLNEEAYRAYLAGDETTHDAMVMSDLERLCGNAEALVLAQASSAGAITRTGRPLPESVEVYTSPGFAIRGLVDALEGFV